MKQTLPTDTLKDYLQHHHRPIHSVIALAIGIATSFNPLCAQVVEGEAAASGLSGNLNTAVRLGATSGSSNVAVGPFANSSISAPPEGDTATGLVSATASGQVISNTIGTFPSITVNAQTFALAGIASSEVESTVDGLTGSRQTSAQATFSDLSLNFGTISSSLLSSAALSISASAMNAFASVTGSELPFAATATSSVLDFDIRIYGISILTILGSDVSARLQAGLPTDITIALTPALATLINTALPPLSPIDEIALQGSIRISNQMMEMGSEGYASSSGLMLSFNDIVIGANLNSGINTMAIGTDVSGNLAFVETLASQAIPEPTALPIFLMAAGASVVLSKIRRKSL